MELQNENVDRYWRQWPQVVHENGALEKSLEKLRKAGVRSEDIKVAGWWLCYLHTKEVTL